MATRYRLVEKHGEFGVQRRYWFGWMVEDPGMYALTPRVWWDTEEDCRQALASNRAQRERYDRPFRVVEELKQ